MILARVITYVPKDFIILRQKLQKVARIRVFLYYTNFVTIITIYNIAIFQNVVKYIDCLI
jgi:hypothetical protein